MQQGQADLFTKHLDRLRTPSIAKELRVTVADTLSIKTETGWITQGGQKYRNRQRSISVQAKQMQPWVTGLWLGLAELFEEHSTTSITDTEQPKLINLLGVKQSGIGMNKMDCDNADIKQYKYDEVQNCKANTHNPQKLWSLDGTDGTNGTNETTENEYD